MRSVVGEINFRGQMKIQQMAFMILAVFLFFILVGLFFLSIYSANLKKDAHQMEIDSAISSISVISDMSELSCDSNENFCLDKDKIKVMAGGFGEDYSLFWPVSSVEVYIVYPGGGSVVDCPAANCNHYIIFDRGQENSQTYSTFVSVCERLGDSGFVYDKCEIGKLVVGVKNA